MQAKSRWCWAACASMVLDHYGQMVGQCNVAERHLQRSDCCGGELLSPCNQTCPVDEIVDVYREWNVASRQVDDRVSFQVLGVEWQRGRPVQVAWDLGHRSRHVVLVAGTRFANNTEVVAVCNPSLGKGSMTYAALLSADGDGRWFQTWLDITPVAA